MRSTTPRGSKLEKRSVGTFKRVTSDSERHLKPSARRSRHYVPKRSSSLRANKEAAEPAQELGAKPSEKVGIARGLNSIGMKREQFDENGGALYERERLIEKQSGVLT
jgi:hypothetical protein